LDALVIEGHEFGERFPGLGVVTPPAGERASLHEDGGPDAWTVVKTVSLDQKYQSVFFSRLVGFFIDVDLSLKFSI
jgi:hypothetical protein